MVVVGGRGSLRWRVLAVAAIAAALVPWGGRAAAATPPVRVWVVLVPGLRLDDIRGGAMPALRRLGESGAAGVWNVSTAGAGTPAEGAATIGAGARLRAPEEDGLGLLAGEVWHGESATQLYGRWVGRPWPRGGAAVVNLGGWQAANDSLPYPVHLGRLGDAVHAAGWRTAVWGDADQPGARRERDGVLLAMDGEGSVDLAWLGEATRRPEPAAPFGTTADLAVMSRSLAALPEDVALVVVELGDLARWDADAVAATGPRRDAERARALALVDAGVAEVLRLVGSRDSIWVLAPSPPQADRQAGQRLAPVAVRAPGWRGALWSPSTRTSGLVTNLDFAPTVLAMLGLPGDATLAGRPMAARATDGRSPWDIAARIADVAWASAQRRPLLIKSYILGAMGVILVTALALRWPVARRLRPWISVWSLAVAYGPLAMMSFLAAPLVRPLPALWLWALVTAALAFATWRWSGRAAVRAFAWAGTLTAAAVFLDLATGGHAMAASPLGFNPIGGARYYGLGNEYMGVALGAAFLAGAAWLERTAAFPWKACVAGAWAAAVAAIGLPAAGANFGGLLAGLGTLAFIVWQVWNVRLNARTLAVAAGPAFAAVAALVWWDAHAGVEAASHLGRAAEAVRAGGWTVLWDIVARKVEMNARLFRYTVWSRGLVVSLAVYFWFCFRPPAPVDGVLRRHRHLAKGLAAVAVASVLALVVNDSGVVAAATASVWAATPLLALLATEAAQADRAAGGFGGPLRRGPRTGTLPEG